MDADDRVAGTRQRLGRRAAEAAAGAEDERPSLAAIPSVRQCQTSSVTSNRECSRGRIWATFRGAHGGVLDIDATAACLREPG